MFAARKFHSLILALGVFAADGMPAAEAYFGSPGNEVIVRRSRTDGSPYGYLEYLPIGYSEAAGAPKVPVILFLHGVGEKGDGESNADFNDYLVTGLGKKLHNGFDIGAIVVSPQTDVWWQPSRLNQFMDYVFRVYKNADPDRLYVTGLSMGGGGTWDFATAFPERPAAIVPICGYNDIDSLLNRAPVYGQGVWAFHAYDDTQVSRSNTVNNINTMTPSATNIMTGYPSVNGGAASGTMTAMYWKAGNTAGKTGDSHEWKSGQLITDQTHNAPVRFTMYASGGHGIWGAAYDNAEMWKWLFTWSKNGGTAISSSPSPSPSPSASPATESVLFSSGSVTIDFGESANGTAVYNQLDESRVAGGQLIKLLNQSKVPTSAAISVLQRFNSFNRNGTTSPAAVVGVDAAAASDSFYGNDVSFNGLVAASAQLALTGLDPSRQYELKFFASRMNANGENRETQYQASGANSGIAYLDAAENSSNVAVISAIRPTSSGTIQIDVRKGPRNNSSYGFYYLNSMVVTAQAVPVVSQEVRVDFGSGSLALPSGWNNGRGLLKSGSVGLVSSAGAQSGYSLVTVTGFNNINSNGTTAASSTLAIPSVASQDSFYGNDVTWEGAVAPKAVLELRGLDPSRTYRLEFFASRMSSDGTNRDTLYRMTGASTVSASLNATNNTSQIAVGSLKPSAAGVIRIEILKGASNNNPYGFYYLGSLKLKY